MMSDELKSKDLGLRTKVFALRVIRLFKALPKTTEGQVIGKQLLRCGTSVGAQYREAKRARSRAEFQSKIESSLQELEEAGYWLELLVEAGIVTEKKLHLLYQEQKEILVMMTATAITTKKNSYTNPNR